VDDHLRKDVPAVLEYVLQATGAQQLHWIGHSMVSACKRDCCECRRWDGRPHLFMPVLDVQGNHGMGRKTNAL
jgi:hypothetical protein